MAWGSFYLFSSILLIKMCRLRAHLITISILVFIFYFLCENIEEKKENGSRDEIEREDVRGRWEGGVTKVRTKSLVIGERMSVTFKF